MPGPTRPRTGWPKTRWIDNDAEQELAWYRDQLSAPQRAADRLRIAVQAAGASLAALLVATGLLWFAPAARAQTPLIKLTDRSGAILCGTVLTSGTNHMGELRQSLDGMIAVVPFTPGSRTSPAPGTADAHHGSRWKAPRLVGRQIAGNRVDRDGRVVVGWWPTSKFGVAPAAGRSDELELGVQAR